MSPKFQMLFASLVAFALGFFFARILSRPPEDVSWNFDGQALELTVGSSEHFYLVVETPAASESAETAATGELQGLESFRRLRPLSGVEPVTVKRFERLEVWDPRLVFERPNPGDPSQEPCVPPVFVGCPVFEPPSGLLISKDFPYLDCERICRESQEPILRAFCRCS